MVKEGKEGKMHILMTLANPFTHDPRVYNEARSLVKAGHKVTVLAWDRKHENPSFETIDEIYVVRSYNTKFMNLIQYDFIKMQFWWKKGYKDALKIYKKTPFDIVHCHDLSSLKIGIRLKKKLGIPIVYDAHEVYGYMIARNLPKFFADTALALEKKWIKQVDQVITVNEPLKSYFKSITTKPITIVMNCKPLQENKYKPPKNKKFLLLYLGSLDKNRFLLELADAIKELPDVHCIIGGKGNFTYTNTLKQKCSTISNVDFIGLIPMKDVLPMTKNTDVVVCMTSLCGYNCSHASANKQFEAMVCGRPIICTKDTYPGKVTEREKCGLVSEYTIKGLKKIIIKLRDHPKLCEELGKNALKTAIREYNWSKQEEKLLKIYFNL